MTQKEFKNYMQRGLGRCYIELSKSSDCEKYKSTVLWGCLHNISFDTQCEGTRSAYLYRLISVFPDKDYFLGKIIERYTSVSGRDTWYFQHLTEIISYFANDGYEAAIDSLQNKYIHLLNELIRIKTFSGYDYRRDNYEFLSIIFLNNITKDYSEKLIYDYGFLFLKNGHYNLKWEFSWFVNNLEDYIGEVKLVSKLKEKITVPEWKCFYDNYIDYKEDSKTTTQREKPSFETVDNVMNAIDNNTENPIPTYVMVSFSRNAQDSEKKRLSEIIEKEPSPNKKAELLRAFWTKNYPGNHETLIEYACSDCEELSTSARQVLSNCRSEVVYQYAKKKIIGNEYDSTVVEIVLTNYHASDKEILLSVLSKFKIDYEELSGWHSIVLKILSVHDIGIFLPKEFFAYIYEHSLCSCCRESAIRYMGKRNWLTPSMISECEYDSNDDIREYIRKKKNKNQVMK